MCWRDEVRTTRHCSSCNSSYFGDLGHRNRPAFAKPTATSPTEADVSSAEKPTPEHIERPF